MIAIVRGFAYLAGHLPFIPYSMTLERYPARTLAVHCRTQGATLPMKRAYPLPLLRKITPDKRTIDTISPVITHDNQPENPYNEILQGHQQSRQEETGVPDSSPGP